MTDRIDGAIIPSGLIASAKTYSLILDGGELFLIHVGPAGNAVAARGIVAAMAVNAVYKRIAGKVAAGEARLDEAGHVALSSEKHSRRLTPADISSIDLKPWGDELRLTIKSNKGKFKFRLHSGYRAEAEAIVAAMQA